MAQKITFTFPASTITGLNTRVLKFYTDSVNVGNLQGNFTPTVVYGSDPFTTVEDDYYHSIEVVKGASINNFANNFYLYLNYILTQVSFYYDISITYNVVELIC